MNQQTTGYTPNLLSLGCLQAADIVYGSLDETPNESYDSYVGNVRDE